MGSHKGGGGASTVELTDHLVFGSRATLRIVVDNAPRLDILPTAGAENAYGGLFRGVELVVCDPDGLAVDGVGVEYECSDKVTGNVGVTFLGLSSSVDAQVRIMDNRGEVVFEERKSVEQDSRIPFQIDNPRLWNGVDDPHLYDIEVKVSRGGTVIDSVVVRTGFRTIGTGSGNSILLNGKPLRIRGVVVHRDRAMVGNAVTPFQIEEDIALIREMGANAVRVVGGRHADYFYDLCDEVGLVVWNDIGFTGAAYPTDIYFVDDPAFRANGRQQLQEMISQLRHHPSVVVWGLFDNVTARTDNDPVPYIGELNSYAKSLDAQRLTGGSSVQDGAINSVTDIISFDLPFGWESGPVDGVKVWLGHLRANYSYLKGGISYSAPGSIYQQTERSEKPDPRSGIHPESYQTLFHEQYLALAVDAPELWGVFVGNMFDFGSWRTGSGNGIDDRGLVTFDRKVRKDAFWAYKAAWNTAAEPFVHIAGARQDVRREKRQAIKVYSNCAEVELFVNGRSVDKKSGQGGVFVWDDVVFRPGINRLEAHTDGAIDRQTITLQ